ncbi:PTS system mannose/fructose/N-acetylgalactosamine-transporter subunit IIB [Amedibacterium intestinale]|uniref:PTS system mannose/fructose/N-acetylgalactosamine-transporter subunit IIB n=1 Tax=Amedibacterium intestinale TaxID=2583452 RepID=UPI000E20014B
MALKLVNIDDRLIHGQVATTWIPDYKIESAIIVNDKVANDPVQKSVAGLAVPNIKVSIFTVDKFIEVLKKTELKKSTMVLFTNPMDALKLRKNGLEFSYLNVSGMRFNDQRTRLHKNMSVTAEEKEAFEELINMGVDVWMQTTTRDSKEPVKELLKNFDAQ